MPRVPYPRWCRVPCPVFHAQMVHHPTFMTGPIPHEPCHMPPASPHAQCPMPYTHSGAHAHTQCPMPHSRGSCLMPHAHEGSHFPHPMLHFHSGAHIPCLVPMVVPGRMHLQSCDAEHGGCMETESPQDTVPAVCCMPTHPPVALFLLSISLGLRRGLRSRHCFRFSPCLQQIWLRRGC